MRGMCEIESGEVSFSFFNTGTERRGRERGEWGGKLKVGGKLNKGKIGRGASSNVREKKILFWEW